MNQQSYNILGITVPRALTTVSTTFFSSIFLLSWSTYKESTKKVVELAEAEELNENPMKVIRQREESMSSTINNIGKKGILFVAIIAVVIIFASDLSVYAAQGILIVLPFVLGAIGTLLAISFLKSRKEPPLGDMVFDHVIPCPNCGENTPLGGSHCESCGKKILTGKQFKQGVACRACRRIISSDSKHCRYCGAENKERERKPTGQPDDEKRSDASEDKDSTEK